MNRDQRESNRRNAQRLAFDAHQRRLMQHTCENCGEKGGHWTSTRGFSLAAIMSGVDDQQGFWTCPKLYGPDGRRLPEYVDARYAMCGPEPGLALVIAAGLRASNSKKNTENGHEG